MPQYVIQHRSAGRSVTLAAGVQSLEPIATYLARQGETGEVVLVEEDTGQVIIRVPIESPDAAKESTRT